MNNYWDKLEDTINPILFKDLRKTLRSKEFWPQIIFLVIVYVLLFAVIIFDNPKDINHINTCFRVLGFISLIAIVIIPLELRKLSIQDVNEDNIYYIFMTNVTASKFINGKLALGIIYAVILFISTAPIYLYVYFSKAIDAYRLIRVFYHSCIFSVPAMVLFIGEGIIGRKNGKTSIMANGKSIIWVLFFSGFLFLRFIVVELIRDFGYSDIFIVVKIDLLLLFILSIFTVATYISIYSLITKTYPMSEISSSFVFKIRKDISQKYLKKEVEKTSNFEDKPNSQNASNTNNKTEKFNNDKLINKPITPKNTSLDKELKPLPIIDDSPELKLYKTKLTSRKKERYSIESYFKIFLTFLCIIGFFLVSRKNQLGDFFTNSYLVFFPIIAVYLHSRDKKYDNRSKLEIPTSSFKKIIKFPFVSGYANGVVWLSIMSIIYLSVYFLTYGAYEIKPRVIYKANDFFQGGFFVFMGFILNTSSWCFIGRFIADYFLKEVKKENKVLASTFFLTFGSSLLAFILPQNSNPLSLLNHILPSMPLLVDQEFFNNSLAFNCSIIFFIITIIPCLKTIYEQTRSYFSSNK